jgi:signal transduction histidine kinase
VNLFRGNNASFTGHAPSAWPVLLVLLAAALVPSLCVLWFMNAAMSNEQLAMRQRLMELYRQHLANVREQLDQRWTQRIEAMKAAENLPPPVAFAQLVQNRVADAVIVRDQAGDVVYPMRDEVVAVGQNDVDVRAQALLAEARRKAGANDVAGALAILTETLTKPEFLNARDASGRLIAPNALLYALSLSPGNRLDLSARAMNYAGPAMPSSQRLMLLEAIAPTPLRAGEELAATYLDANPPAADTQLRRAAAGIWTLASGRMTALFRDETFASMVDAYRNPPDVSVVLQHQSSVGKAPEPLVSLMVGDTMPDWRLALYSQSPDLLPSAANRRVAIYVWTAGVVIFLITAMTFFVGRYVTRQVQLTHLKNDLIATVSHELKTPLASMRVLLDTLLDERCTDARQREDYVRLIAKENHRLSRLIENFLTFSRMERHKGAFEMQPVDVREIVFAARDAVGDRFTNGQLRVDVAENLPPVEGDRDALLTVLVNLLDNAHKYTKENKLVNVRAFGENRRVTIEVSDNGIGIPRRALRRVFDRFYQVDQSLSRKTGGCGLGLAIVQFIVQSHGGEIHVQSAPNEGTTFTVLLPAVAHA